MPPAETAPSTASPSAAGTVGTGINASGPEGAHAVGSQKLSERRTVGPVAVAETVSATHRVEGFAVKAQKAYAVCHLSDSPLSVLSVAINTQAGRRKRQTVPALVILTRARGWMAP